MSYVDKIATNLVCCRCNDKSSCARFRCVKVGRVCENCLPLRKGHCKNADLACDNSESPQHQLTRSTVAVLPMPNLEPATGITTSPYSDSPSLPTFMPSAEAQFSWGDRSAAEFTKLLDDTYREVTQWQKPLSCSCWELRQGFCI